MADARHNPPVPRLTTVWVEPRPYHNPTVQVWWPTRAARGFSLPSPECCRRSGSIPVWALRRTTQPNQLPIRPWRSWQNSRLQQSLTAKSGVGARRSHPNHRRRSSIGESTPNIPSVMTAGEICRFDPCRRRHEQDIRHQHRL